METEEKIPGQIPMFYGNTDNSGFSGTRMNPDKEKQLFTKCTVRKTDEISERLKIKLRILPLPTVRKCSKNLYH